MNTATNEALPHRRPWLTGAMRAAPIMLGYIPVGFAFGVLSQKAGISLANALLMSLIVYAGSAQLIAAGMFAAGLPGLSIVLTTFIVNLRHMLMSAALSPFLKKWRTRDLAVFSFELTDESFAVHSTQFATLVPPKKEVLAMNLTAHISWILGTWLGMVAGQLITDVKPYALDYALNAMFVALLILQIKDRIQVIVAIATGVLSVALLLAGLNRWNVLAATLIGATIGVVIEQWAKTKSS